MRRRRRASERQKGEERRPILKKLYAARLRPFRGQHSKKMASATGVPGLTLAPGCLSTPPLSFSPLTPSGFFNGMLEISELGALNFYTFFC